MLVDGHSFAYRAFFAIRRLNNSKGQPTNAVYGFAKMVRKLLQEQKPTHGAVVMDRGLPAKRLEQLPTYKAQRKPMPEDLGSQIPLIEEFVESSSLHLIQKESIEADDIIATLAKQGQREGMEVAIATSDKDFMQLVGGPVVLLNPAAKEAAAIDKEAVKKRYGVEPEQIVDLLSLTGDSVDNVPGVPGVGEKTAAALLQQFGSVDRLFADLAQVTNTKLRQKLEDHRAQVEANRKLVSLDSGIDLDVDASQLGLQRPDFRRLIGLCERLEFRSLKEEIQRESQAHANPEFSLGA